uniref:Large ribosomal subunit protein uL16m n=1 Tax=Chlorella vulgaris TaxID=3077 RepID=A0A650ANR0_CHLVU|nr:ribosomal protein L16 [Chlorella vulgaris]QGN75022.1 ribosomal protein L16 [Chlorella vulgaris]QGN75138.1 ribosomal protein L16 [Chlorella vulgaris]
MLQPKRTKFRKFQKGRVNGILGNTTRLEFGEYGLKTLESGRIPAKTIEAVRRILTRKFKRLGQIWIRIFPDISVSSKPAEVRMGKGKGAPSFWVCRVKKGQILFEMDGISSQLAKQASLLAYYKLPLKTKFITRD